MLGKVRGIDLRQFSGVSITALEIPNQTGIFLNFARYSAYQERLSGHLQLRELILFRYENFMLRRAADFGWD